MTISGRLLSALALIACAAAFGAADVERAQGAETTRGSVSGTGAFRDSVGVVAHVNWLDTPYGQWDRVVARLRELGVAHIRAGIYSSSNADWNTTLYDRLNAAVRAGIRLNLVVPFDCSANGSIDPCLSALKTRITAGAVDSVEWPNEPDNSGDPNWQPKLLSWGHQLYAKMKADPALRGIEVIGPVLVNLASRIALGDQSSWLDRGNVHPYTGATSPTPQHIFSEYGLAGRVSGPKPIVATETGYHTSLVSTTGDQPAADEASAAVYTLRAVLENYLDGIERSYVYELINPFNDPLNSQANYGLLRNDWTPKPAFTALKNLLTMVGTSRLAQPTPLPYGLVGDTSDLRRLVLEQADGSHLLILWRTASVWNRTAKQRLAVAPKRYLIGVPGLASFAVGDPVTGPSLAPGSPQSGEIVTDVGADPVVLRIRRQGDGPGPGAGGDGGTGQRPQGTSDGDRRGPRMWGLRVRRSKGRLVASFRLSEAAKVATRIDRAKKVKTTSKAKPRVRARYRATKRLAARRLQAGKRKIVLGRLKAGRLRVVLSARDASGNKGSVTRAFRAK